MSRFNNDYILDSKEDYWAWICWEGRRKKVLNGKPGKAALQDLERALLAMPHKRLIEGTLCDGKTGVCAMGAWLYRRYVDEGMRPRDAWRKLQVEGRAKGPHDYWLIENDTFGEYQRTIDIGSRDLGITKTLAEIVAYINDEEVFSFLPSEMIPEKRYDEVLRRVRGYIAAATTRP